MSQSKREKYLKENERYPLRSLTNEARQAFEREEDLAEKREKAAVKRREDKKAEKEEAAKKAADTKKAEEKAEKDFKVTPKEKKSWRR